MAQIVVGLHEGYEDGPFDFRGRGEGAFFEKNIHSRTSCKRPPKMSSLGGRLRVLGRYCVEILPY